MSSPSASFSLSLTVAATLLPVLLGFSTVILPVTLTALISGPLAVTVTV
jgi:hypothetical protein